MNAEKIITDEDITARLVGQTVIIHSRAWSRDDFKKYMGQVISIQPRRFIELEDMYGLKGRILFCDVTEGIHTIEDINGHRFYQNDQVLENYNWGYVDDSPLQPEQAREVLSRHGRFYI